MEPDATSVKPKVAAERWQQLKALLAAVLEVEPGTRSAFLDQACAQDPSLRPELDRLLAAQERAGPDFLNSGGAMQSAPVQAPALTKGSKLGDYEIISLIGSGGMGEVYRARDAKLKREVAIKVLPAYWSSDPARLQRFELEAQAAATLSHPNIVSIFHVGQYDGSPYIVTELLHGETLRERLQRGPIPLRKAVEYAVQNDSRIVRELLDALASAALLVYSLGELPIASRSFVV